MWTDCCIFAVSGDTRQRRRRSSVDRSMVDVVTNFAVYRCFYPKCIPPPPATLAPIPNGRPSNFVCVKLLHNLIQLTITVNLLVAVWHPHWGDWCLVLALMWNSTLFSWWSDESFWKNSRENNFTVPKDGSDVVIPSGKTKFLFIFYEN